MAKRDQAVRSKLFVPGVRGDLFTKAMTGMADAISFDLEDSVVESRKAEARKNVADILRTKVVETCEKIIIVRVNGLGTPHFEADIQAIMHPSLSMINLPKVESAEEVSAAANFLERVEKANGIGKSVRMLVNIESAKGLLNAAQIAAVHSRVAGLQLGLNDLFESMAIDRRDTENVHAAMFTMRMAAGGAGVFSYDGAFAELTDMAALRAEAQMAQRLGFVGKSCIHPDQVSVINEIFTPGDNDVVFARRVLAEAQRADAKGVGVFTVDGNMVDLPLIRRAEAVVAAYQSCHKE